MNSNRKACAVMHVVMKQDDHVKARDGVCSWGVFMDYAPNLRPPPMNGRRPFVVGGTTIVAVYVMHVAFARDVYTSRDVLAPCC